MSARTAALVVGAFLVGFVISGTGKLIREHDDFRNELKTTKRELAGATATACSEKFYDECVVGEWTAACQVCLLQDLLTCKHNPAVSISECMNLAPAGSGTSTISGFMGEHNASHGHHDHHITISFCCLSSVSLVV